MVKNLKKYYKESLGKLSLWAQSKVFGLFVFNLLVMLLIVLRSAGYFTPYFPLTINLIVFLSLILAIILLNMRSSALFIIALVFWIITAVLRIQGIEVWAERAALYTFQALVVGVVLLVIEIVSGKKERAAVID